MEYTVKFNHVEPDIQTVDFQGKRLVLTGTLAWFFRLFKSMKCEEEAVRELYPWLMEERNCSEKKATLTPANVALNPEIGATKLS